MLLLTNKIVLGFVQLITVVILLKYIQLNRRSIFIWEKDPCNHEAECLERYMKGPIPFFDPDFLNILKEDYLIEPPKNYNKEEFDISEPLWRNLVDWQETQETLHDIWKNQPPGIFVEIGAMDGVFMSQTLHLERNLSWSGLLIEPDPRSFELLRAENRNAWLSNVCIAHDVASTRSFWIRPLEEDLPFHFQQMLLARSKMNEETLEGDELKGEIIWKLCVPISSLLTAANLVKVDMLSIATGGEYDEDKITDILNSRRFDVKTILVQYPGNRFLIDRYPDIKGYIMDMGNSQLLTKLYVKKSHCELVQKRTCKKMKYYDSIEACIQYFCLGHLTVWTYDKKKSAIVNLKSGANNAVKQ